MAATLALAAASPGSETAPGKSATAIFSHFRYEGRLPGIARPALPPGYYRNPIIAGSYSDPSIVRVGDDYYLTNASFVFWPGLPIFHSRDLVHWRQIGSALDRPSQVRMSGLDTWQGIYAPALAWHDGLFYLVTTCQGCGGNFIMTAPRPEGPWSDPHWLPFEGIDPSLFFDTDGRGWIVNSGPPASPPRYDGHRAIWVQEIDPRTLTMIGPRTAVVDGGTNPQERPFWTEGPHLFRKDGGYVLICAEGGTKEHHHEIAFRADGLRGPWHPAPLPILSQLGLDPARPDPVVQTGHADLVATPAGDWWAVFLGSRPWGPGELDYNTGRETFLLPVDWRDGWPVILPLGTPVPTVARAPALPDRLTGEPHGGDYALADDFGAARLAPIWAMLETPVSTWWRAGGGALRLAARPEPLGGPGQPSFLGVRQQHMNATVTVVTAFQPPSPGARAGLAAYQGVRQFFALSVAGRVASGREVRLERMAGPADPSGGAIVARKTLPAHAGDVRLKIDAAGSRYSFAYAYGRVGWRRLGPVQDGSILGTTSAQGFTGVLLGPFAYAPKR